MKLTEKQRETLEWVADPRNGSRDLPGYYTAFPRDTGTFKALERRGLVVRHEWQRSSWALTDSGRAALAHAARGEVAHETHRTGTLPAREARTSGSGTERGA